MASASPAAPALAVEAVQNVDLTGLGSNTAPEYAVPPRFRGVQASDVMSVWMATDEEDALAAGEFVMIVIVLRMWQCCSAFCGAGDPGADAAVVFTSQLASTRRRCLASLLRMPI